MKNYLDSIQNNADFGFFHTPIWQNIVRDVYKVQSKPLLSVKGSEYAFLTNFEVNNLLSGHKFTNMPFNFYPKPLYDNKNMFIDLILELGKEATKVDAYIELKMTSRLAEDILKKTSLIETTANYVSILKLPFTYDDYKNQISQKFKANLNNKYNKFSKNGFFIKKVSNIKELDEFYYLLARTYRNRHRMVCQPKLLFKKLFLMKDKRFSFEIKTIRNQGNQICSAIAVILDNHGTAYYSWGITDQKYYKYSLSYVLINELIKDCIKKHYKIVDFGSTPKSDQNLLGFKNFWGCQNLETYNYYLYKIPEPVDLNSSYKCLRYIFSKTPMFIINLINSLIVPQLA